MRICDILAPSHLQRVFSGALAVVLTPLIAVGPAWSESAVGVQAGPWKLKLPAGYELRSDISIPAYRAELGGSYHTAVMEIAVVKELVWNKDAPFKDPDHPEAEIRDILWSAVRQHIRKMEDELAASPRLEELSVEPANADLLPDHLICAARRWAVIDKSVKAFEGTRFVLRGFNVLCFDYVLRENRAGLIGLRFSERFCQQIGHEPLDDIDGYLARILEALTYLDTRHEVAEWQEIGSINDLPGTLGAVLSPLSALPDPVSCS